MKKLILWISLWGLAGVLPLKAQTVAADLGLETAIRLYGEPVISANPDLLNSTSNSAGPWGAPEFLYSLTNDFGTFGAPEAFHGVANDFGQGLKIQIIDAPLDGNMDFGTP